MRILYDSKKACFKQPFGCLKQNEECKITIHVPVTFNLTSAKICILREDGFYTEIPMIDSGGEHQYRYLSGTFSLDEVGLYFYFFKIVIENSEFSLLKQGMHDTSIEKGEKWQIICYNEDYDTPDFYKGCIMYQIFPDRFNMSGLCNANDKLRPYIIHQDLNEIPNFLPDAYGEILNNDFFGGNLRGITEKLSFLKELSVSVIYLNPIFMAFSNHRYDTADYKRIDPLLGSEEDFAQLCRIAHDLGIRVVLDGVFSHTGSNSVYFDKNYIFGNGAVSNKNSPYKDWYNFQSYPNQYSCWWGIKTLPSVDKSNQSYIDFIINDEDSVISHWMKLGADGFRLDVADELPDEFIKRLHERVKELNPQGLVIGEVWEDASNKISYGVRRKYLSHSELDSVMNYPIKNAVIDFVMGEISAKCLADKVMTIAENYPKPVLDCLMNSLSTHDTARILTVLGAENFHISRFDKAKYEIVGERLESAIEKQKVAAFLQFVLPGSGCIYYGEEIGMQGFEDPFNRGYYKWGMQNTKLFDFYKDLTKIKASLIPLKKGNIEVCVSYEKVFGITRTFEGEAVTAVVNMGSNTVLLPIKNVILSENSINNAIKKNGFVLMKGMLYDEG